MLRFVTTGRDYKLNDVTLLNTPARNLLQPRLVQSNARLLADGAAPARVSQHVSTLNSEVVLVRKLRAFARLLVVVCLTTQALRAQTFTKKNIELSFSEGLSKYSSKNYEIGAPQSSTPLPGRMSLESVVNTRPA